ncbi:unnamed protein product, partial [Amoebophrya sp. A25]
DVIVHSEAAAEKITRKKLRRIVEKLEEGGERLWSVPDERGRDVTEMRYFGVQIIEKSRRADPAASEGGAYNFHLIFHRISASGLFQVADTEKESSPAVVWQWGPNTYDSSLIPNRSLDPSGILLGDRVRVCVGRTHFTRQLKIALPIPPKAFLQQQEEDYFPPASVLGHVTDESFEVKLQNQQNGGQRGLVTAASNLSLSKLNLSENLIRR